MFETQQVTENVTVTETKGHGPKWKGPRNLPKDPKRVVRRRIRAARKLNWKK